MPKELTIRSDEAHRLATELAARTNRTTTEIVEEALRDLDRRTLSTGQSDTKQLTPEQQADHEDFMTYVRNLRPYIKPGATSDHRDLYDENGLPR